MYTDYKFWYILRDDDGFITECTVRFYEGEYQEIKGEQVYVRTKRLETLNDLSYLQTNGIVKAISETNGKKAIYYNQQDFGQIKIDDELRNFMNKQISKDKGRQIIPKQLWLP